MSVPAEQPGKSFDPRPLQWSAAGMIFLSLLASAYFLARRYPADPWESAMLVDGWRVVHHLPVYTDPQADHATHMYGVLATYLMAAVVKIAGLNFHVTRLISFVASWLLIGLTVCWFRDRLRSAGSMLIAVGLLAGLNLLGLYYFTASRPDLLTLFLSAVAITCWYRGYSRGSVATFVLGAVISTIAFLFKQPAAGAAIALPLAILLDRRRLSLRWLALSFLPIAMIAMTITLLKAKAPWVYYYMVLVPRHWKIGLPEAADWFVRIIIGMPLLLLAAYQYLSAPRRTPIDPRLRWAIALLVVEIPLCALAVAKEGGGNNSLLPAMWVAVVIAFLSFNPSEQPAVDRGGWDRADWWRGCLIAAAAWMMIGWQAAWMVHFPRFAQGDRNYHRVIELASKLPGRVISPDDPTIALLAKGYAGRAGQLERDNLATLGLPAPLCKEELRTADWCVAVACSYLPSVEPQALQEMGFVEVPFVQQPSVYHLWHRQAAPGKAE